MKLFRFAVPFLVALFACAAFGQGEPAFPPVSVKMIVTAEAHHGKEVPQIRSDDVVVTQEKQHDRVVSWQPINSSDIGVQEYVLIDDSLTSSDVGTKLGEIRSYIESQPASVQVGVAYMRNGTAAIGQNLTADHALAAKALRLPIGEPSVSASPYFSLQDLLKHWPQANAVRKVVMISSGIDPYYDSPDLNDPYVESAIAQAQREGVIVNAIYARTSGHAGHTFWRVTWGQNFLSELADATGGEAYYLATDSVVSFAPYFKELDERSEHQYLLTFEAQPGKKPGLQKVKVSAEVPNVELVAQHEVYVGNGM